MRTLPNFWNHSSCDHAVTRACCRPGRRQTAGAGDLAGRRERGRGPRLRPGELLPFWQLTSEQDWQICERQQKGVDSRLHARAVLAVQGIQRGRFVQWYLQFAGGAGRCLNARILIVGGGAVGCSIAYHLGELGE